MVIQREGYKFVIIDPAKTWISEGKCAGCGKPKSEWKRTDKFKCCSPECTTKMQNDYQYFGWPALRFKVLKRDKFTCVKCGTTHLPQTTNYDRDLEKWVFTDIPIEKIHSWEPIPGLVADHIIPIALGGSEWDINNIQTLCLICNKIKTRNDAADIALARVIEKSRAKNHVLYTE